jgi:hypothetical protein
MLQSLFPIMALIVGLLSATSLAAQSTTSQSSTPAPDLDDLERRLEAAKAAAAKKERADTAAAEQRKADQKRAEGKAAADPGKRGFVDLGGGILRDTKTGLEWTQNDNGSDIDWISAREYCASRGGGWQLPSVAELHAIYDANVPTPKICWRSSDGTPITCKVSNLFNLTGVGYWSSEMTGNGKAFNVSLAYGDHFGAPVEYAGSDRALCVHHP